MQVVGLQTKPFLPPQSDISSALELAAEELSHCSVLAVTSKLISIHEGRCLPVGEFPDKDQLITLEADYFLPRAATPYQASMLTIKNGRLIGSAGVDQSNADGHYILLPEAPYASARSLLEQLQFARPGLRLGVVVTDSISLPTRRGAIGSAVAWAGFDAVTSCGGESDIFGRMIRWGRSNVADALATAAVLKMGEGSETTPLAVLSDLPESVFAGRYDPTQPFSSLEVPVEEDIYRILLNSVEWQPGGGGYVFR